MRAAWNRLGWILLKGHSAWGSQLGFLTSLEIFFKAKLHFVSSGADKKDLLNQCALLFEELIGISTFVISLVNLIGF